MTTRGDDDAGLAAAVVREAGRLAATMRAGGIDAEQKTSVSDVVTAADRAAEALVVRRLLAARPDDGVVGEEGAARTGTSGRTWVVDPVDGTYNFVRGSSWWCSALALAVGDEVVLGAVHHPATDATYVGGTDLPATRDGVALAPLVDRPLAQACVATYLHPPLHGATEVAAAHARAVGGAATVRMLGSGSMDATALVEGRLDLVLGHSVPDWDRMPGEALVRSLGGRSEQVEAGGVRWYVAGVPTAVGEVCAALRDR